FTMRLLSPV
nr:Chain C, dengue1 poly peptide [dengue virus type 1]4LCY_J Chain J, dengue1 poly peptide [dengue virus type 1]